MRKHIEIRIFSDKNNFGAAIVLNSKDIVLIPTISFSTETEALYNYYVVTFSFLLFKIGFVIRFRRDQKKYIIKAFKNE